MTADPRRSAPSAATDNRSLLSIQINASPAGQHESLDLDAASRSPHTDHSGRSAASLSPRFSPSPAPGSTLRVPSSSLRATSTLLLNPSAGTSSPGSSADSKHPIRPPSRFHSPTVNRIVALWVSLAVVVSLTIIFFHEQEIWCHRDCSQILLSQPPTDDTPVPLPPIATARVDQIPKNPATIPVDRNDWAVKLAAVTAEAARIGNITQLVMIGDSITALWLDAGASVLASTPWLHALQPLHLAVGGDQTCHILWRLDPALGAQLAHVSPRTRVVILLAGTNNSRWCVSAVDTLWGLRAIVLRILAHFDPGVQVIVFGVLPRADCIEPFQVNQAINRHLRDALHSPEQGVYVYEAEFTRLFMKNRALVGYALDRLPRINSALFEKDQLHLRTEGYAVWAEALKPIVEHHMAIAAATPLTAVHAAASLRAPAATQSTSMSGSGLV